MFFSLKRLYFSTRVVSSLSRILAMWNSDVSAVNFPAQQAQLLSFVFLTVTCAPSLFPASASRKFFNRKCDSSIRTWPHMEDSIIESLKSKKIDRVIVPGGCIKNRHLE